MKRKDAIKGIAAIGLLAAFPNELFSLITPSERIHFIGLGGAGGNVLEHIYKKGINAKYTFISNSIRPDYPVDIEFIQFVPPGKSAVKDGKERFKLTDMSIDLVIPSHILDVFKTKDKFVLFAGLGGYTGTYFTDQLIPWLNLNKKEFQAICCKPFSFESGSRMDHANRIIEKYQHQPNFKYLSLEDFRGNHGHRNMAEFFEIMNEEFYKVFLKG